LKTFLSIIKNFDFTVEKTLLTLQQKSLHFLHKKVS